jgi:prefoldin subunit 5
MKYTGKIEGDLVITKYDDISEVTEIWGNITIKSGKHTAQALTSVDSRVYVYENATFKANALTSVGGSVNVYKNATFEANALTSVGGGVYVYKNATFKANALTSAGSRVYVYKKANENPNNFYSFLKLGYLFADGILAKIISKKGNVYKIQICGKTKISYCVQKGNKFAHGDTIKEAKESLIYKLSDRDTTKYKSWNLETVITKEQAIESYMAITGACSSGTRHFVEGLPKVKAKYTVKEVIELTKGQYNNNLYNEFFKEK